jgi:hypothetical protein
MVRFADSPGMLSTQGRDEILAFLTPLMAEVVDKRTSDIQAQLTALKQENAQRDAQANLQSKFIISTMLRGQADNLRARVRAWYDKHAQFQRAEARLAIVTGSDRAPTLALHADLKVWLSSERDDIHRVLQELQSDARLHSVQLTLVEVQDFLNRQA